MLKLRLKKEIISRLIIVVFKVILLRITEELYTFKILKTLVYLIATSKITTCNSQEKEGLYSLSHLPP